MASKTGMDSKRKDSRERIVETTARLLRVQGYHATGLNQIVEESQAPKGSLYHYFPAGKEELASEAMELAGTWVLHRLEGLLCEDPSQALDHMVDLAIKDLEASDYRDGCPLATVSLETSSSSSAIRGICSRVYDKVQGIITAWLIRQGIAEDKAPAMAMMVFASYQGAMLLSKVHNSPEPLRQVVPQIKQFVKQSLT
jgi:TetR/AcrR family transcriptional repressor of lmrAB and yxaGH operons